MNQKKYKMSIGLDGSVTVDASGMREINKNIIFQVCNIFKRQLSVYCIRIRLTDDSKRFEEHDRIAEISL